LASSRLILTVVGQGGESIFDIKVVVDSLRRPLADAAAADTSKSLKAYLVRVFVVAGDLRKLVSDAVADIISGLWSLPWAFRGF
jgi:hypothetical protein